MTTARFTLATDVTMHVSADNPLHDAFYREYGAQAWNEESEAATKAAEAINRAMEHVRIHIIRLYELTGNLAVVGDGLYLRFPTGSNYCRMRIVRRDTLSDAESDNIMILYLIGVDGAGSFGPGIQDKDSGDLALLPIR